MSAHSYSAYVDSLRAKVSTLPDVQLDVVDTLRYDTLQGVRTYDYLRIASKSIGGADRLVLLRAGIHGDEDIPPIVLMHHIGEIFQYAHARGIKLVVFPLDNPSGFEYGLRYNVAGDCGAVGNNDFVRFELNDGRVVDRVPPGGEIANWRWASDPALNMHLPAETAALHRQLRRMPLTQVAAVVDLHQDPFLSSEAGTYFYFYPAGRESRYADMLEAVAAHAPLLTNRMIGSGQTVSMLSNASGGIVVHDGTLPNLAHLMGVADCITVETTGAVPFAETEAIHLTWVKGIVDLASKDAHRAG